MSSQSAPGIVEPLDAVVRALELEHGLDISHFDDAFLRTMLARRLEETGIRTLDRYVLFLKESRPEAEQLSRSLLNHHSSFFRNPLSFALLEQVVLPALVKAKSKSKYREIRIWSAGCATGQEPWSIAILLEALCQAQDPPLPYRIFATDLDGPDLARARAGVYSTDEVGDVRSRDLRDSFVSQGDAHAIIPALRERVDFSVYDLLDDSSASPPTSIYGGFDLVLCCNVLLYYRPTARRQILNKILASLSPDGYFVTGEAERAIVNRLDQVRAVAPPSAVFQMIKSPTQ